MQKRNPLSLILVGIVSMWTGSSSNDDDDDDDNDDDDDTFRSESFPRS